MSARSVEYFDSLTDAQVLQRLREIERGRRQFEIEEAALTGQVRSRGLAFTHGCTSSTLYYGRRTNCG